MKIGITYNLKDELSPEVILGEESYEEFDTPQTISAIQDILAKHGHNIIRLGGGLGLIDTAAKERVDLVFNIAEGYGGRNRESHIPSILEMLGIPYSGSDPLTLGLALDKVMTKKIALFAGIPTPRYGIAFTAKDLAAIQKKLRFPLITKPSWEGSSKGIYITSRVMNDEALAKSAEYLFKAYPGQPVLIEEYIEGRELAVGIMGNEDPKIIGVMEIVDKASPGDDFFYSLETKRDWLKKADYISPPDLGQLLDKHIRHYALAAFREFGCRDMAKIDFRISKNDRIYMLEVNPLPGLSPERSDMVIMAQKNGIKYEDLILSVLNHALSRTNASRKTSARKPHFEISS